MKRIMVCILFFCFFVHIPHAHSQDKCPLTIEGAKNDSRFEYTGDNAGLLKIDSTHGLSCVYYKNGKLHMEAPYRANKIEGIAKVYYESGKLKEEIPSRAGKGEGIAKYYYESGKLEAEIPYKKGIREGVYNTYRKNSKMFATITYVNGTPVSGMCHHTNGSKVPLTNAELDNWKNGLTITCD